MAHARLQPPREAEVETTSHARVERSGCGEWIHTERPRAGVVLPDACRTCGTPLPPGGGFMRVTCYLRQIRGDRGLLKDFAGQAGINKGTLSAIEAGYRFPTDAQALAIKRVYEAAADHWYPPHVVVELGPDKEQA